MTRPKVRAQTYLEIGDRKLRTFWIYDQAFAYFNGHRIKIARRARASNLFRTQADGFFQEATK